MPYYGRGNYAAGDNYGRTGNYPYAAGGIFGSIGKALGGIAKAAVSLVPGPIGAVARAITSTGKGAVQVAPGPALSPFPTISYVPPAQMGPAMPGSPVIPLALPGGRSRRMNVMNVKALRRAGRRVKGFLKIARRLGALPVNTGKGKRIFKVRRKR